MKPIIEVSNLSKKYKIGARKNGYVALRDILAEVFKKPFYQSDRLENKTFWALDDVNFLINPGEVVGIIGPNGAGKSTLLKILTQITPPTRGEVILRGRVASLLEVGTGFHPELTGRENIFLNGAILGMNQSEIKQKFDEIVEFSGVEQFIDTPIKRYSSGMQVRLAFSVAAHLESEILLVDEVLAVGDAEFQQKCLGKMESVNKQGRTVLFVSHNMGIVSRLCQRGILLKNGHLVMDGEVNTVVKEYLKLDKDTPAEKTWTLKNAPGDEIARLLSVKVLNQDQRVTHSFEITNQITIQMEYKVLTDQAVLFTSLSFYDNQGTLLFVSPNWDHTPNSPGIHQVKCSIPGNLFAEGMIRVVAEISTKKPFYIKHVLEHDAVSFQIVDHGKPDSVRQDWGNNLPGVMRPKCDWVEKRS